ncbi:MAG: UDP-N-acetylmuramoyl-L-alanine--D-glutamate ligase [Ignavibacteria bacterium]|nr:MAG: UDP-N-acetylmuramoyl-L-alanine--D-glutamate ligase [Ignavibacteria bacterium]
MAKQTVAGKQVTVLGAARSGAAVARLLQRNGASVFVSDSGSGERLKPYLSELESLNIEYETGKHMPRALDAELLVISPGIPSTVPVVQDAQRRGVRVVSELEVASWFCPAPIIAVTGTNGKTTTTALIGRMLDDQQKKHIVAGNIGVAFSSLVDRLDRDSIAVLEVSSFQLDHIESFRPHVSVILNITSDHLDRYERDFARYAASKSRIFQNQTEDDFLVFNSDDAETQRQIRGRSDVRARLVPFGIGKSFDEGAFTENGELITILRGKRAAVVPANEISIPGIHNLYNSMAATLAGQIAGVSVPSLRATLKNFKGVEHRLEFVRELGGVRYVNDSKATNVDAVWYALQSFKEPIVLLLGGRDKGNDYTRLYGLVDRHVKAIVAIGESAEKVAAAFSGRKKVVRAGSMKEAVNSARAQAAPGDVVLLSPACASFDWFKDYEHRGVVFKEIVNAL